MDVGVAPLRAVAPAVDRLPVERVVELVPRVVTDRAATFWLTNAIGCLDILDPEAAGEAIAALLPLQASAMRRCLRYEITVEGMPTRRVQLGKGTFASEVLVENPEPVSVDFSVTGTATNLAPLYGSEQEFAAQVARGMRRRGLEVDAQQLLLAADDVERRWREYFPGRDVEMGDSERAHLD